MKKRILWEWKDTRWFIPLGISLLALVIQITALVILTAK